MERFSPRHAGPAYSLGRVGEIWRGRFDPPSGCEVPVFQEEVPEHIARILGAIYGTLCSSIPKFVLPRYRRRFARMVMDSDARIYLRRTDGTVNGLRVDAGGLEEEDYDFSGEPIPWRRLTHIEMTLSYYYGVKKRDAYPEAIPWAPFGTEARMEAWLADVVKEIERRQKFVWFEDADFVREPVGAPGMQEVSFILFPDE